MAGVSLSPISEKTTGCERSKDLSVAYCSQEAVEIYTKYFDIISSQPN